MSTLSTIRSASKVPDWKRRWTVAESVDLKMRVAATLNIKVEDEQRWRRRRPVSGINRRDKFPT